MEYYILINNIKEGPYQKEELLHKGIDGDTLVWCTGMTEWKKAREIPELDSIISQLPPEPPKAPRSSAIMPKTWLLESILVTIFCCLPFGIVGIVYASKVEEHFINGNYQEAEFYSAQAKKWTLWGLLAAVILVLLYFISIIALGLSLLPFLNS